MTHLVGARTIGNGGAKSKGEYVGEDLSSIIDDDDSIAFRVKGQLQSLGSGAGSWLAA
jgi:hypothetical protein